MTAYRAGKLYFCNSSLQLGHLFKTKPERLSIGSLIGSGSFGTVHAAEMAGQLVAVKTIHLQLLQGGGRRTRRVVGLTSVCHLSAHTLINCCPTLCMACFVYINITDVSLHVVWQV